MTLEIVRDDGEHAGARISGALDGQLDDADRQWLDAHLSACEACRAELVDIGWVRDEVRALPPIAMPEGFVDVLVAAGPRSRRVARHERRLRLSLANVVATAAVWVVILGVVGIPGRPSSTVEPQLGALVSAHASIVPGTGQPSSPASSRLSLPADLGGTYRRVAERDDGSMTQGLYSDEQQSVSVFLSKGRLNHTRLDTMASRLDVNGLPAWYMANVDGYEVMLVQRGEVVIMVVGARVVDVAPEIAGTPELATSLSGPSLTDRMQGAARGFFETFGFAA